VNLPVTAFGSFCCAYNSYGQTVYYKGAAMLNALRSQMGTTAFFRAMRQIQASYRFGIATTAGVIAIFEAGSPNKAATAALLHKYMTF
jgi:aminopeptidase N